MSDSQALLALAERCEAASGPDREIDGAIDRLLNNRPEDGDYDSCEHAIWRVDDAWSGLLVRGDGFARGSFCASEYTASLDAAMSLTNDLERFGGSAGMVREAMDRLSKQFRLHINRWPNDQDYGQWLARFLTAAILRARAEL